MRGFLDCWLFKSSSNLVSKKENGGEDLASLDRVSVLAYIGVVSPTPYKPYPINDMLSGKFDADYQSTKGVDTPSITFSECKVYSLKQKEMAFLETARAGARVGSKNSAYILEMSITPEQAKKAAAEGKFSQFIVRAVPTDNFRSYLEGDSSKTDIKLKL